MSSSSTKRAVFATTARLLSCLVTESLARAIFAPLQWPGCVGIGVVLKAPVSADPTHDFKYYSRADVLAIVLLKHVPVFKTDSSDPRGKEIGLLDPLDMFPLVLAISGDGDSHEKEVWLMNLSRVWVALRPFAAPSYIKMICIPRSCESFHRPHGPPPSQLSSRSWTILWSYGMRSPRVSISTLLRAQTFQTNLRVP